MPPETRAELERLASSYLLLAFVSGRPGKRPKDRRCPGRAVRGNHGLELDARARAARPGNRGLPRFRRSRRRGQGAQRSPTTSARPRTRLPREPSSSKSPPTRRQPVWFLAGGARCSRSVRTSRRTRERRCSPSSGNRAPQRALYAGDDTTDLDAFAALAAAGLEHVVRIAVDSAEAPPALETAADIVVPGQRRLPCFWLASSGYERNHAVSTWRAARSGPGRRMSAVRRMGGAGGLAVGGGGLGPGRPRHLPPVLSPLGRRGPRRPARAAGGPARRPGGHALDDLAGVPDGPGRERAGGLPHRRRRQQRAEVLGRRLPAQQPAVPVRRHGLLHRPGADGLRRSRARRSGRSTARATSSSTSTSASSTTSRSQFGAEDTPVRRGVRARARVRPPRPGPARRSSTRSADDTRAPRAGPCARSSRPTATRASGPRTRSRPA